MPWGPNAFSAQRAESFRHFLLLPPPHSTRSLPPEVLLLEVSERALTSEPAAAQAVAARLASIGVPISLDDFATGRASLGRLRGRPVSEIKIDSSFSGRLPGSPPDL